eukprot:TRINITY_DN691_c2_g4_i1.p1 TRINITY_DN691_c2_g4~~TRINITY_DN691_c2_g4_i1.p1  ORF type:complete len:468 (+),score=104.38 TRINITY_DN691_c2_g4_i1:348-1751(+)
MFDLSNLIHLQKRKYDQIETKNSFRPYKSDQFNGTITTTHIQSPVSFPIKLEPVPPYESPFPSTPSQFAVIVFDPNRRTLFKQCKKSPPILPSSTTTISAPHITSTEDSVISTLCNLKDSIPALIQYPSQDSFQSMKSSFHQYPHNSLNIPSPNTSTTNHYSINKTHFFSSNNDPVNTTIINPTNTIITNVPHLQQSADRTLNKITSNYETSIMNSYPGAILGTNKLVNINTLNNNSFFALQMNANYYKNNTIQNGGCLVPSSNPLTSSTSSLSSSSSSSSSTTTSPSNNYPNLPVTIPAPEVKFQLPEKFRISVRNKFPTNLSTRYLLASLLCCAQNQIGAKLIWGQSSTSSSSSSSAPSSSSSTSSSSSSDNKVIGIEVVSYKLVKNCCIIISHEILGKRATATHTSWDKTFRQRWFEHWTKAERFQAHFRVEKLGQVNEHLQGHTRFTEDERQTLISVAYKCNY